MSTTNALPPPSALTPPQRWPQARQGLWLMGAGGALLGTLGVFLERADAHPLTAVWFRCAFGAAALLFWAACTGRLHQLRLHGRTAWAAVAAGLLVLVNWASFFAALKHVPIGVATVAVHLQPVWLLLFGALALRERVTLRQWIGVFVALFGLALASGLSGELGAVDRNYLRGLMMCLAGSVSYAAVTLIGRQVASVSALAMACWQCLVGAVLLSWWPLVHGWPPTAQAWGWLAGLGVIHTGLAYVLLYGGAARLPAGPMALMQFVYPGVALGVDALVYGHRLSWVQGAGVLLMAAALWGIRHRGT